MSDVEVDLPAERSLVADASWAALRRSLEESGAAVFELDFGPIADGRSFLERAATELPAEPSGPFRKWAALSDALWAGLAPQAGHTVVWGWRHVDRLLDGGLATLLQALDIAGDLQRTALDADVGGLDEPVQLFVVLTGDGPNFPTEPVG